MAGRSDQTNINVRIPRAHVAHLDAEATYHGMSRAAYLRGLIVRDIERQGPAKAKAPAKATA